MPIRTQDKVVHRIVDVRDINMFAVCIFLIILTLIEVGATTTIWVLSVGLVEVIGRGSLTFSICLLVHLSLVVWSVNHLEIAQLLEPELSQKVEHDIIKTRVRVRR